MRLPYDFPFNATFGNKWDQTNRVSPKWGCVMSFWANPFCEMMKVLQGATAKGRMGYHFPLSINYCGIRQWKGCSIVRQGMWECTELCLPRYTMRDTGVFSNWKCSLNWDCWYFVLAQDVRSFGPYLNDLVTSLLLVRKLQGLTVRVERATSAFSAVSCSVSRFCYHCLQLFTFRTRAA